MNDPLLIAAALFALAVLLLVAELMLPGGVLGGLAALCMVAAVVLCFVHSSRAGVLAMVGVLLATPVFWTLWVRNAHRLPGSRRLFLAQNRVESPPSSLSIDGGLTLHAGQAGVTVTALRPGGEIEILGHRVQAYAETQMIAAGVQVIVVSVSEGRATVRPMA